MNLHVETLGHGPDLVLIHGWAMHAGIFAPLTRALAPHFRLHLVDLPGHGYSRDVDAAALEPARCATLIAQATPPALWLGWSLGGLIAQRGALDHARQVRGLIQLAASPRFVVGADWPHGVAGDVFGAFADGLRVDYHGTIERFLALEAIGSPQAQAELRALRAEVFARGEPATAALCEGLRILDACDQRAELARLAMPSLWIGGWRDRLIPLAAMHWAAAHSPQARTLDLGAGHAPFISHADAVAAAIGAFASDLTSAAVPPR